ncbi:MAG: hypothetical protein WCF08_00015 [Anaerolineaceae bacterium]
MIKPYECTQCGSTDFEESGIKRVTCAHCGSLFEVLTDDPTLTINKGARVIFGKNSNIEIRGDMEVQDGADVDIQGKVVMVKGKQKHLFQLKLIEKGR